MGALSICFIYIKLSSSAKAEDLGPKRARGKYRATLVLGAHIGRARAMEHRREKMPETLSPGFFARLPP
jgi:hypothetical protein